MTFVSLLPQLVSTYIKASGVFAGSYQFMQEQTGMCASYGAEFFDGELLKLATSFMLGMLAFEGAVVVSDFSP